jgi:hypothetical protein
VLASSYSAGNSRGAVPHAYSSLYFSHSPIYQARYLSASQRRLQAHILYCTRRYISHTARSVRPARPSAPLLLPTASLATSASPSLAHLITTYSPRDPVVLNIIADRVALPESNNPVPVEDLLSPELVAAHLGPHILLQVPPDSPPRGGLAFASHAEYLLLLRRLLRLNMVEFTCEQPPVINGMFGTPKPDAPVEASIRLITDARPANALFTKPPPVDLPSPDVLANLQVPDGAELWVAKADLDNFYHRLLLPAWLRKYFALPAVTADDLDMAAEFGTGTVLFPLLRVLAMGWSHSVFIAQTVHEHTVVTKLRLEPRRRIRRGTLVVVEGLWYMIYIDDFGLLSVGPAEINDVLRRYLALMASLQLPAKLSKVHFAQRRAKLIGVTIDGSDLTIGVDPARLLELVCTTEALLYRGYCTGNRMAQLVGDWTWAMLCARPSLAVFNAVYKFIKVADRRVFEIWPSVHQELRTAIGLAPVLFTSLRQSHAPVCCAVDASLTGQGVCAMDVEGKELERTILSSGFESWSFLQEPERWRPIVSAHWKREEHINALECRAAYTALRWILSHPGTLRTRMVIFSDSSAVTGALAKGRSSGTFLLPRQRRICALLLASGVRLTVPWIPSELNPADVLSRR